MKLDIEKFPLREDTAVKKLFQIFAAQSIEIRFVGGCVRDGILGLPARDIDLAVPLPPAEVVQILRKASVKIIPVGYDFGCIKAFLYGRQFQLTSLRQDGQTTGRYPQVIYSTDWEADAGRRDFTINALYADIEGNVIDYFEGIEDLHRGTIRFIGEANKRIREDYLRILRYFRFLAWYGYQGDAINKEEQVHKEALQACRDLKEGLKELSRERIGQEFLKLLAAPLPLASLSHLAQAGIIPYIFPESAVEQLNLESFKTLLSLESPPHVLRRLMSLFLPLIHPDHLARALCLTAQQRKYLFHCKSRLADYEGSEILTQKNLYQDGSAIFLDLTLLNLAFNPVAPPSRLFSLAEEAHKVCAAWRKPDFPLKGQDLLKAGLKPGGEIGVLLKECESWWIEANFLPTQKSCLRWVMDKKKAKDALQTILIK